MFNFLFLSKYCFSILNYFFLFSLFCFIVALSYFYFQLFLFPLLHFSKQDLHSLTFYFLTHFLISQLHFNSLYILLEGHCLFFQILLVSSRCFLTFYFPIDLKTITRSCSGIPQYFCLEFLFVPFTLLF